MAAARRRRRVRARDDRLVLRARRTARPQRLRRCAAPRGGPHRAHGRHEVPRRRGLPLAGSHRGARGPAQALAGGGRRAGGPGRGGDRGRRIRALGRARGRRAVKAARRGQLVLVATPIGNLGDLSPRAREVLETADLICCEDTRRTRALLSASGIPAGGARGDRLLSLHGHNEAARLERVAEAVAGGATVAVVSDAGTPGISDPGALLAAHVAAAGEIVSTVPG